MSLADRKKTQINESQDLLTSDILMKSQNVTQLSEEPMVAHVDDDDQQIANNAAKVQQTRMQKKILSMIPED